MTTTRPFTSSDLFTFNLVNLDVKLTETYNISFYLRYLITWPELCLAQSSPSGSIMGYIFGKVEGEGALWHGHVTAVTVAPEYRRLGCAKTFMLYLERVSENQRCYFVDLFVRKSNRVAISMYTELGYVKYREIIKYYSGAQEENAYDMRKALSRDVHKASVVPLPRPITVNELEFN
jgi:N-terminal acetyltransferase B complex catalytic subunit